MEKESLKSELNQERLLLQEAKNLHLHLEKEIATLSTNLGNLKERHDEIIDSQATAKEQFQQLAIKVLDQKTRQFDEDHKKGIKEILEPLKERINRFEERVDQSNKETITRHAALNSQLNNLKDLNQKITEETINLTNALKGDNKMQGNWGEIILESILQKSGLEKNREYTVQPTYKNEEGKMVRPDIVIHLPDEKKLIIDSKVSLKSYEVFISSDNETDQSSALKALSLSIKNHVNGLASKKYHDIYKMESPDFVLMFIPIDTAFNAALSYNPDLYSYAFDKNIVIVTSSTLLATLKTVDTMWKNVKQQKHAYQIAEEAGKMYDKFANLVDDLIKVGERMDMSKNVYNEAMKKLHTGKGNLISRADKMKTLGAKVNKELNQFQ
ncbi:MAG: DNA recombination protein RmuC [Saprospiraceae bacterium]|nr:DNA recombination protein RmuC [Saprospiraceae bacterium]